MLQLKQNTNKIQTIAALSVADHNLTYMGNNTGVVRSKQDPATCNTSIEIFLYQPLIGRVSVTDDSMISTG